MGSDGGATAPGWRLADSRDAGDLIFALPPLFQAAAAAFVKRCSYEWEQEHRFTVGAVGLPSVDERLLSIPNSMYGLVAPAPV